MQFAIDRDIAAAAPPPHLSGPLPAVCVDSEQEILPDLRALVAAGFPLIIVAGSGGLADEIARVQTYLREVHRSYTWSVEPAPVAPFPMATLSLEAAGFLSLYREPGMSVSVWDDTHDSAWLYRRLKGEFHIHSNV